MNLRDQANALVKACTPEVEAQWEEVAKRVLARAAAHHTTLVHPFDGMSLTKAQEELLRQRLVKEGMVVKDYTDPDPGYPGSRAYTEVSWK